MTRPTALFPLALLFWCGCATYTGLTAEDRGQLERSLERTQQYLRVSCNVTPFFGDGSKRLLTPLPPSEVDLLESPSGEVISPGPVEKIIPAGTRVRVERVEFPTTLHLATRILYTPRTQPWIYLTVEGQPDTAPFIIVLRQGLHTRAQALAELDEWLSREDLSAKLATYSEPVRHAVQTKQVIADMPADALEAAWGLPQRKQITFEDGARKEVWSYPTGARKVYLSEGRVVRVEGGQSQT